MLGFFRQRSKDETKRATEKTRQRWFGYIGSLFRDTKLDDELWEQLEERLVSLDVGIGLTLSLVERLQQRVKEEEVTQSQDALVLLKQELTSHLLVDKFINPMETDGSLQVFLMVGVNGVGKTTSIAKLVQLYKNEGKQVLLGGADTFRAAGIEQLQVWGGRLGVDVITGQPGADPASVAFDALQAANNRDVDVLIIDTAGRLHTNVNLMEEIKKIQRVLTRQTESHLQRVLLIIDATTGQNGLVQARSFTDALDCDGVFLTKLDGTAKGGVVLSISDELKLPVMYIGTGEQPDDIAFFDAQEFVNALFDETSPIVDTQNRDGGQ